MVPAQANVLIELRLASRCNIKRQPMSALGQKQTSGWRSLMSALPPKADIAGRPLDVRFVPKAAVSRCIK
jgi:hypothetical protein